MDGAIEAIASVRAGFLFAFLGMVAQVTHIWLLTYEFSSFEGAGASIQAWVLSSFLGGGLLFFTVRAGNPERNGENPIVAKTRYTKIANAFAIFEAFINLYYWGNKIVFKPGFAEGNFNSGLVEWHQLFLAIPLAIAIPVILKQYAGEIRLSESTETTKESKKDLTALENDISKVNNRVNSLFEDVSKDIKSVEETTKNLETSFDQFKEDVNKFPGNADFKHIKSKRAQPPVGATNPTGTQKKKMDNVNPQPLTKEQQKSKKNLK